MTCNFQLFNFSFHLLFYCKNIGFFQFLDSIKFFHVQGQVTNFTHHPILSNSSPTTPHTNHCLSMPAYSSCLRFNLLYLETIFMTLKLDLHISIVTLIAFFTCLLYHLSQLFNYLHGSTHSPTFHQNEAQRSVQWELSLLFSLLIPHYLAR